MHNKQKTHCPHGHAYTDANTKLIKSTKPGKFKRQCRECRKRPPGQPQPSPDQKSIPAS